VPRARLGRRLELAHAVTCERDPVGAVDDAIEDGIGERRVADDLIPSLDRQLAGDQDRTGVVAILDDLQEVAALLGIELLRSPVVEDEKIDAGKGAQELGVAAIAAGEREGCEQPRHAMIEDGEVLPAGLVTECASEPAFADATWTRDQKIAPLADEVAAGELEEQGAIEAAGSAVIDVLDAGVMAQPCGLGAGLEALLSAQRHLVLEQQAEPFGMLEAAGLGGLFERLEAFGHAVQAEVVQQIEGRMGQHG
jgi:hypothetical protein